jgi:hypothetical protein
MTGRLLEQSPHWHLTEGKPLQLEVVKPGDIISKIGFTGERVYAKVIRNDEKASFLNFETAGKMLLLFVMEFYLPKIS